MSLAVLNKHCPLQEAYACRMSGTGSGGSQAEQAPTERREEGGTSPGESHGAGGRHSCLPAQEILETCKEYCSGNRSEGVTQAAVGEGGHQRKATGCISKDKESGKGRKRREVKTVQAEEEHQ